MALGTHVCLGNDRVTLQLVHAFCEESPECSSDLPVLISLSFATMPGGRYYSSYFQGEEKRLAPGPCHPASSAEGAGSSSGTLGLKMLTSPWVCRNPGRSWRPFTRNPGALSREVRGCTCSQEDKTKEASQEN